MHSRDLRGEPGWRRVAEVGPATVPRYVSYVVAPSPGQEVEFPNHQLVAVTIRRPLRDRSRELFPEANGSVQHPTTVLLDQSSTAIRCLSVVRPRQSSFDGR